MAGILLESLKNTTYVLYFSIFCFHLFGWFVVCSFVLCFAPSFTSSWWKCTYMHTVEIAPMMFIYKFVVKQIDCMVVIPSHTLCLSHCTCKAMKVLIVMYASSLIRLHTETSSIHQHRIQWLWSFIKLCVSLSLFLIMSSTPSNNFEQQKSYHITHEVWIILLLNCCIFG